MYRKTIDYNVSLVNAYYMLQIHRNDQCHCVYLSMLGKQCKYSLYRHAFSLNTTQ